MNLKEFIKTEISKLVIQPHYDKIQLDNVTEDRKHQLDNVTEDRKHLGQCLYVLDKNPEAYKTANAVFKALFKEGMDCLIFIKNRNIQLCFYGEYESHEVFIPL